MRSLAIDPAIRNTGYAEMCIRDSLERVADQVEIIDVHGGQLALKRREDAADGHVHALSLFTVDVPENAEDYVHRIGRTGRAEASGDAFTIMTADERDFAAAVENFIGKPIERKKLDGFNSVSYTHLDVYKRQ